MKKGRNRWFALLLILTMVFTLGMPVGMTAFGEGVSVESGSGGDPIVDPSGDPDGDVPDGDVTDGDVTDGDVPDGDVPDGDVPDGDVPDGDVPDGDVPDGDVPDGDVPDGDVPDGSVHSSDPSDGVPGGGLLNEATGDDQGAGDGIGADFRIDPDRTITLIVENGGIAYVGMSKYGPGSYSFEVLKGWKFEVTGYANAGYMLDVEQTQTDRGNEDKTITVGFSNMAPVHGMPYYSPDGSFSGYDSTGNDISDHDPKDDLLRANMSGTGGTVHGKLGQTVMIGLNVSGVNGDYNNILDRNKLHEVDFYDSMGNKITRDAVGSGDTVEFSYTIPGSVDGLISAGYTVMRSGRYHKTFTYELVDRYNGTAAATVLATANVELEVDPTNATIYITADDYYELYIDGNKIGDDDSWGTVEAYRVALKDNSIVAVYAKDLHQIVDGLSVKIDYDNAEKPDVLTTKDSGWFYHVIPTASVPASLSEWNTAPVIYKNDGWAPVENADYGWKAKLNGHDWNEPWVWTSNYTAPDFDKYVLFRFNGAELGQQFVTLTVNYDGQGKAYIGEETDPLVTERSVEMGGSAVLHAVPAAGWMFAYWTVDGNPVVSNPGPDWTIENADASHTYTAHFIEGFNYSLTLDPADDAINVPKDKVLTMTFNGQILPGFKFRTGASAVRPDDFRIYNADGSLFESYNVMMEGPEIQSAGSVPRFVLTPTLNSESTGYIEGNQVVLDPKVDFTPGASYYVLTNGLTILNMDIMPAEVPVSPFEAWFLGFTEKETLAEHDWNFTIAPATVIGGGGGGAPGGGATGPGVTTTTITPDETPLAAPIVEDSPLTAPAEALQQLVEEVVPLGVPVLPKTGEIPATLFYGLGGIIAAAGAFMKRK